MTRRRSSTTTSGPVFTSRGVTVIVVESPVVVLCNFAGNGFAGAFLAGAFFASEGFTIFGERVVPDFDAAGFTAADFSGAEGAAFLVATAFLAGVADVFLATTDFTAFLASVCFALVGVAGLALLFFAGAAATFGAAFFGEAALFLTALDPDFFTVVAMSRFTFLSSVPIKQF